LELPKVVSEHFTASITANYECARKRLWMSAASSTEMTSLWDQLYVGIGRGKEPTQAASREQETAVVIGKTHTNRRSISPI
jgi:hypothetical protein